MTKPVGTYTVSPELLARPEMRALLRSHDFANAFRLMKKNDGASQDRIASAVDGLDQSRISKVVNGKERITTLDLIERISDGLRIPGGFSRARRRQNIHRRVDELTISLAHRGVRQLSGCTAVEERPDGSEISATDNLTLRKGRRRSQHRADAPGSGPRPGRRVAMGCTP